MKHKSEYIIYEDITYYVRYAYQKDEGYYSEPTNIASWVEPSVYVHIDSVKIIILDQETQILQLLNNNQLNILKSKLTYQ